MKRLDAHSVARAEQTLLRKINDRERPHAIESIDRLGPPLFVRMDDHLGVRVGPEDTSGVLELHAKLEVVVNLAVEDDPNGTIFVSHGLKSEGTQIDNC